MGRTKNELLEAAQIVLREANGSLLEVTLTDERMSVSKLALQRLRQAVAKAQMRACAICSLRAFLEGRKAPLFPESTAAHNTRFHPNFDVEQRLLEAKLAEKVEMLRSKGTGP